MIFCQLFLSFIFDTQTLRDRYVLLADVVKSVSLVVWDVHFDFPLNAKDDYRSTLASLLCLAKIQMTCNVTAQDFYWMVCSHVWCILTFIRLLTGSCFH